MTNDSGNDMNKIVGTHDILFIVLDTLRYDVAEKLCAAGRTPNLARLLPNHKWEKRHTPGSFTYAAHQAFFAGFLPTPVEPGRHERLFALRFEGSVTTGSVTCVLDGPDIVTGLRARGYHTACIGGVGFFNKQNPLGCVLPNLFDESHWSTETGVTDPRSTEHQVDVAKRILSEQAAKSATSRLFLFMNISALHQPNYFYLQDASNSGGKKDNAKDTIESHGAALEYIDRALEPLFTAFRTRSTKTPTFAIVCSDHGSAYGEDGFRGHRVAHPSVWNVPYGEFILSPL
jgi:Sulfatase